MTFVVWKQMILTYPPFVPGDKFQQPTIAWRRPFGVIEARFSPWILYQKVLASFLTCRQWWRIIGGGESEGGDNVVVVFVLITNAVWILGCSGPQCNGPWGEVGAILSHRDRWEEEQVGGDRRAHRRPRRESGKHPPSWKGHWTVARMAAWNAAQRRG